MIVRYEGTRLFSEEVLVEAVDEDGSRSRLEHAIWCHSAGFDWGYGGSGPSELALNLLAHALGDEATCPTCKGSRRYRGSRCPECRGVGISDAVWRAHHDFKWAFIAGLPERRWSIDRADILQWWSRAGRQEAVL